MSNGNPLSPKFLKGAFVGLNGDELNAATSIITFQYNPETMSHTVTPISDTSSASTAKGQQNTADPTSQPCEPAESFSLTLELDATDQLEFPDSNPVAVASGVADRLAALEMLLHPGESIMDTLKAALKLGSTTVPRGSVPIVLFIWGPGLAVPVRITSFRVEEQKFSSMLYPVQAKVTVELQVITADSLEKLKTSLTMGEKLAIQAYKYTLGQKKALAAANLANSAQSVINLLPF